MKAVPRMNNDKTGKSGGVIISQFGGYHAHPAAEAAHAAGMLDKFIVTHPQGAQIPSDKLIDLFYTYNPIRGFSLLRRLTGLGFFSKMSSEYEKLQRWYFDYLCCKLINEQTKIFHAYSCYQEKAWARCEELGVCKIIEHGTAHPLFDAEVVGEEYKRYGVDASTYSDTAWITRMTEEHERVDRVYVISDFARKSFERFSNVSPEKIKINRLGVDTELFAPKEGHRAFVEDEKRPLEIMTGGYICLRKGTQYLLEAVKNLKKKKLDCRLSLYGAQLDFGNVLAQYDDIYDHLGGVGLSELIDCYNRADVLVLPSLSEGFGRVVTEAMACGTLCIVSENTGAGEIIENGVDGFVVPVCNSRAIEEALELLYNDRSRVIAMGRRAREKAVKNNWQAYQRRLIDDYKDILSGENK